jgi:hypothetical protein
MTNTNAFLLLMNIYLFYYFFLYHMILRPSFPFQTIQRLHIKFLNREWIEHRLNKSKIPKA